MPVRPVPALEPPWRRTVVALSSRTPAVVCEDVSKRFYVRQDRTRSIRELFVRGVLRRPSPERRAEFSLRDFSLRVDRGESVALVGANGSGKSTALRLIAGVYAPTSGHVAVHGRVAAIIELGVGFHPELTGRENVMQYAAAVGLRRREILARLGEVLEFAAIGDLVDEPLRIYSTGMGARLAFAAAVLCARPDILLVDEVLSVGDHAFQDRCMERLRAFQASGGTLIAVSHDLATVRGLCSRAVWMSQGAVRMDGEIGAVLAAYTGG
jgi:ABC-type polysaccharide/polyol phosphate transport system ATPase subunit